MKYAFTSFSCPHLRSDDLFLRARQYGYDGIEPRIGAGHQHGVELDTDGRGRREIKQAAIDRGIALCCLGSPCAYTEPGKQQQHVDETRRCIDLAADVGAPRLRVFAGRIPTGGSREHARDLVGAALSAVAEYAAHRGVTVCVETHDDWSAPASMADLMKGVDHPAIGVVWDVMHPVRQGGSTLVEAFQLLQPWVKHVHIHDGSLRLDTLEFRPIGEGAFDHRQVLTLLRAASYDGYLSGEWIDWEPCETHLPRELAAMKRYERDVR